jgi:Heparinase II/III-like protein/Heparinase II/III N-terminus
VAVAVAAATLAAGTGAPEAANGGLLGALRAQPCPDAAFQADRTYSKREIARAKRGRFIFAGDRAKLKRRINWFQNHRSSREFQKQLHSWRWAEILIQAYRDGDRRALLDARRIAIDWIERNRINARKRVPAMAWFNLPSGVRAPYLGYITRASACEGMLPKPAAKTLLDSIRQHGAYLSGRGYFHSNHGLFTDLGLFLLADRYAPFFPEAQGWENTARERFPQTLAGRTSESGVWLEHSTDYHFLAMRLAEDFLRLAGPDPRVEGLLGRLRETAAWLVEPDGKYALIGDSSADRAPVEIRKQTNRLNGFRTFQDAGYFVVSRAKRYLAVMNGFHSASHKQSDELSFELFDRDKRVITGPGKYGFDRDAKRAYVLSNASHSVLTVDKKPWRRNGKAAYGSGILASGQGEKGWFAVLGRNPLTERQGVTHTRLFVYHPLVGLFILDTVDSRSGKHEYRRYLQFGEDIDVERTNKRGMELDAKNPGADFDGCVRDEASPEAGSNLRLDRGKKRPYEGYTFPKGERGIPRWTATWRSKATDVSHLYGIGLQRGCPFSVERVPGSGIVDFVLTREGEHTVQITVTRSDSVLHVAETELSPGQSPPPPQTPPPLPPVPPPYGEGP